MAERYRLKLHLEWHNGEHVHLPGRFHFREVFVRKFGQREHETMDKAQFLLICLHQQFRFCHRHWKNAHPFDGFLSYFYSLNNRKRLFDSTPFHPNHKHDLQDRQRLEVSLHQCCEKVFLN